MDSQIGGRVRKRRGVKVHLLHQMKDSGKEQRCAWSSSDRKVMRAVGNFLERSADIHVDVGVLERLIEPEEEKFCLRYILKYSTRRGSSIFQFFNTSEKMDHLVEHQRERVAVQERWPHEWHDIEYQRAVAKAPPCPESTLRTPLPQQARRQPEKQNAVGY